MGKVSKVVDMWVVVEPKSLGDFGFCSIGGYAVEDNVEEYRDRCNDIISDIKRHVDNADTPYIHFECEKTCEFCGAKWTEGDDSPHNGGCCEEDIAIMEATDGGE